MPDFRADLLQNGIRLILMMKNTSNIPTILAMIFLAYGIVQPFYFVLRGQAAYRSLLVLLLRPEIYFLQVIGFWNDYTYLVVLIAVAFEIALISFLLSTYSNFEETSKRSVIKFLLAIQSIYQQLLMTTLIFPLSQFCIVSFQHALSVTMNFFNIFASIITFVLLQLNAIAFFLISDKNLTYNLNSTDHQGATPLTLLAYSIRLTIILIEGQFAETQSRLQTQHVLLIFLCSIELINQYLNQTYMLNSQQLVINVGNVCVLFFALFYLVDVWVQNYALTLSIHLIPLLYNLLSRATEEYYKFCFIQQFDNDSAFNFDALHYQLVKNLNRQDSSMHLLGIRQALIASRHHNACTDLACICQKTLNIIEPLHATPVPARIERKFLLKQFEQISRRLQSSRFNATTYYKFALLLYSYGFIMQAVKHFNLILGEANPGSKDTLIWKNSESTAPKLQEMESNRSIDSVFFDNKTKRNRLISSNLGIVDQERIKLLKLKGKAAIKLTFGSSLQAKAQNTLSTFIQQYLDAHFSQLRALRILKQTSVLKIKLNESILRFATTHFLTQIQVKDLFNKLREVFHLERLLLKCLYDYDSQTIRNLVCYFQAEIQHNHCFAYRIQLSNCRLNSNDRSILGNRDEKYAWQKQNQLSSQVAHLFISVNEDMRNLTVESYSPELCEMLELKDNKNQLQFTDLVPRFLAKSHPILIERFLTTGKSIFFRNFCFNYVRMANGLIKPISMCIDKTDLLSKDKLVFVTFLQEISELRCFMLVDSSLSLSGISQSFLSHLGYSEEMVKNIVQKYDLDGVNIANILPCFNTFLEKGQNLFTNQKMTFLNFHKLYQQATFSVMKNIKYQLSYLWTKNQTQQIYFANLTIMKREVYQQHYYVIEFSSIALENSQSLSAEISRANAEPYIENSILQSSNLSEQFQILDEDDTDRNKQIQILDIQPRQRYAAYPSRRNSLHHVQEISSSRLDIGISNYQANNQTQLISKRESMIHQQQFYNNDLEEGKSFEQIQEELNRTKMQNPQFGQKIESSYKTQNGLKGHYYFKKFEIVDQLLKPKSSKYFTHIWTFFTAFFLLQCVFLIIVFTLYNDDLSMLLNEIGIVSIYAKVMGPHDLFFSMRFTVNTYDGFLQEGWLSEETHAQLTTPYKKNMDLGYQELQDNYYQILQQQYLSEYLSSVGAEVFFMRNNHSDVYQSYSTFIQILKIILQYQFGYQAAYKMDRNITYTPYQVFTFYNYVNFHKAFQDITVKMHQHTKTNGQRLAKKWENIWLTFMVALLFLNLVIIYYQWLNIKLEEQLLQIISFIEKEELEEEIGRLKIILKLVDQDPRSLKDYDWTRAQQDLTQKFASQSLDRKRKAIQGKANLRISVLKMLVASFVLYSIFCIYATTIYQLAQIHYSKYSTTTDLYMLVQQMKVLSGNMPLHREIIFKSREFEQLSDDYIDNVKNLMDLSEQVSREYIIESQASELSDYLVSEEFTSQYRSVRGQNLCQYLDDDLADLMRAYCQKAYNQVLLQGLVPSLNFIINKIRSEQSINDFTQRVERDLYELEGSQIITRVCFKFSRLLEAAIADITARAQDVQLIISTAFLVSLLIEFGYFLGTYRSTQHEDYQVLKSAITLVPLPSILLDSSLERYLKRIILLHELNC